MAALQTVGEIFREAWGVLTVLIVVAIGLLALWRVLEASVGVALGGSGLVSRAVWGVAALAFLGLLAFGGVPALLLALSAAAGVGTPACAGPVPEMVLQTLVWVTWAVVALTGLRLLLGLLEGIVSVGVGGSAVGAVRTLLEGVGALLLLSLAGPLAVRLFCA